LALADKEVEQGGLTCVTWALTYPSTIWEEQGERLETLLDRAALALGIDRGCCNAEVMLHGGDFFLLEMTARAAGGHIYTTIVEHVSGVDYVEASIRGALGEPVSARPTRRAAACYRFLRSPEGELRTIAGLDEAAAVEHVHDVDVIVQPGDRLERVTHGAARAGWVVALADRRQQVVDAAEEAAAKVRFEVTRPDGSGTSKKSPFPETAREPTPQ
jgi:biotin carboxylase